MIIFAMQYVRWTRWGILTDMLLYCTEINDVTEEQYNCFFRLMDENRKSKASRYRRYEDRVLSTVSYALLQYALHLQGLTERDEIVFNQYGKPLFKNLPVHFNISHTKGAVACAVQNTPVGVDIQEKVSDHDAIMHRVCTEREVESVLKADDPALEFTLLWTLKESILKCIGTGIGGSMLKYDFSENKDENSGYKLFSLCDGGCVLSACAAQAFDDVRKISVAELYEFAKRIND